MEYLKRNHSALLPYCFLLYIIPLAVPLAYAVFALVSCIYFQSRYDKDIYSEVNSSRILYGDDRENADFKNSVKKIHFYYRPSKTDWYPMVADYRLTPGEYVLEESGKIQDVLEKICFTPRRVSETENEKEQKKEQIGRGMLHIVFEFDKPKTKAAYLFLDCGKKSIEPIYNDGWDSRWSPHDSFCDWLQDAHPQIFKESKK